MSKEGLQLFIEKVTESDELQALIGDEIDVKSLIALGAEYGCEFSGKDLMENVELSDEELDGGTEGVARPDVGSASIFGPESEA